MGQVDFGVDGGKNPGWKRTIHFVTFVTLP
jgi:hypothetical protein